MDNSKINEYLSSLKSSSPTPGGGSANCLVAKVAVSLALMSINVSKKRKSFSLLSDEVHQIVNEAINRMETSLLVFESLSEEDEEMFNKFMQSYKTASKEEMEDISIACLMVPYKTFEETKNIYNVILQLNPYIVSSITSDYKMSLELLRSVFNCCKFNIEINEANIENNDIHTLCKEAYEDIEKFDSEIKDLVSDL